MKKKIVLSGILLGCSILLYALAMQTDGFATWYLQNVYPMFAVCFSWVMNFFPVSVVECMLYIIILIIIVGSGRSIYRIRKKELSFLNALISAGANVLLGISMLLFLYVVNCGINYHSSSFIVREGFTVSTYTREELIEVCTMLTEEINDLEKKLEKDQNGNVVIGKDTKKEASEVMRSVGKIYPSLSGYYPSPKELMLSEILSYQSISGIYSPFTVEANINGDMPDYMKPFTMCHELAHLKGIMREEEANFAAYLACRHSSIPYFQYSGAMSAYYYCMSELMQYDSEAFVELRKELCDTANQDIVLKHNFWSQYDGIIAQMSNKMNDAYLKANAQTAGVDSYNEVAGLILAYYQLNK